MPAQHKKSSIAAKLGAKLATAVDAHKNDDVKLTSGADLPAGIEAGIAQLVECKFDVYEKGDNKGEYYFYAAGVVVSPTEHNGVPLKGLRTSIGPEPVCDTQKADGTEVPIDVHVDKVLNEMRKLGADTSDLGADDLEATAAALKESGPYFRFRTWQGKPTDQYPNPRVNHDWRGVCEYVAEAEDAVDDQTAAEPAPRATAKAPAKAPSTPAKASAKGKPVKTPEPEPASDDAAELPGADDLTALGEAADGGDEDAAATLAGHAKLFNIDSAAAPSWADVAEQIVAASAGDDTNEETNGETEFVVEKSNVLFYKFPRTKKPVEVEVQAVFPGARKANIKSLDDGKLVKGVSWDELSEG